LNNIKKDIEMLRERYESGKPLFDKFSQWHSEFKMQKNIEEMLNTDRARKNRGGCLAGILKDQKKANSNAELYLRQLRDACEKQADLRITIEDLSPYQFALHLIQERGQQKENERENRVRS
jgi:hydroxypyruvate isomerase